MPSASLTPDPLVWAEFVILAGEHSNPYIHARVPLEKSVQIIAGLLEEEGSVDKAVSRFIKEMDRWVRHA